MRNFLIILAIFFSLTYSSGQVYFDNYAAMMYETNIDTKPDVLTDIVRWYKFNEGTGTSTAESAGIGYALNMSGACVWTNGVALGGVYFGGAGYMSNGQSGFDMGYRAGINDVTYSIWVRYNAVNVYQPIIDTERLDIGGLRSRALILYVTDAGKIQFWNSGSVRLTSDTTLSALTWYNIVLARTGNDFKLYINGAWDKTVNYNYEEYGGSITVGRFADSATRMTGIVDELRIYSRGLSDAEVLTVYNKYKP